MYCCYFYCNYINYYIIIRFCIGILSIFSSSKKHTVKLGNGYTVSFTDESLKLLFKPIEYNNTYVNYTEQQNPVITSPDDIETANAEASCSQNGFCTSCLSDGGLFGCRWCPKSTQCHAWGSIYNPCSSSEQITNINNCPTVSYVTNYDENISLRLCLIVVCV